MHSVDHPHPSRQRGPHNDPSMLDGDSGHGNPGEPAGDEWAVDTDTDVDAGSEDELDDAVADPTAETDEEVDDDEASAEVEEITTGSKAFEEVDEQDVEPAMNEETADETDLDTSDEEEVDEDDAADEPSADPSLLEAELDRQMDRTSTDAENPAHHPPPSHETLPPIDGYDALTIPQIVEQSGGLDVGQLNAVLEYEQGNRNRKTLVAKLTKLIRSAT